MNEEQAKQWLIDNGFYSEYDKPSNETHLSEAAIIVDDEHVEIVMKLTEKKNRTISLEAYIKMQNDCACMLRANGHSFDIVGAKEMVDRILEHNNVVVEGE